MIQDLLFSKQGDTLGKLAIGVFYGPGGPKQILWAEGERM